jgi:membrane protein implicated in regulation of membrane protease activity
MLKRGGTNVAALVGKKAIVIKEIAPFSFGRVKVGGEDWAAISENNATITEGKVVVVTGWEGVKLIVREEPTNGNGS